MKLTTLGAAAAAFAAYAYLKRQRSQAATADDTLHAGEPAMPGTGAESPQIAERMRAAGMQATSTDLPDLTRGA